MALYFTPANDHSESFAFSLISSESTLLIPYLGQQSPDFLAPGTSFLEDHFPMDQEWGMIQVHYIYCRFISIMITLALPQTSVIRSWRLGTPVLGDWRPSDHQLSISEKKPAIPAPVTPSSVPLCCWGPGPPTPSQILPFSRDIDRSLCS